MTSLEEVHSGQEGWMERRMRGMHVQGEEVKVFHMPAFMSMEYLDNSDCGKSETSTLSSEQMDTSDRVMNPADIHHGTTSQMGDDLETHSNPNDTLSESESLHHNDTTDQDHYELPHHNTNQQQQQQPPPVDEEEEDAQIIIIGGWLGSGPLAASDTWILDISSGLTNLRWFQPPVKGTPPGPCNMHSADYIPSRDEVYVFRGGNGREYLNDLHAFDVENYQWRVVETGGAAPQQRANHSSAVLETGGGEKTELFIFGGWNGSERLNDIFVLDVESSTWSEPRVGGVKPHPRAGMTLTALRGRLYLFGGSGTSSKCFDDLQILDRKDMAWLDVNDERDGGFYNSQQLITYGNSRLDHHDDCLDWYFGGGASHGGSLGGQDGMTEGEGNDAIDANGRESKANRNIHNHSNRSFADWRSQENHHHHNQQLGFSSSGCTSANPNDEDMVHSVFVTGNPPGKRAGHTATAVGRFIYVFGGSCGTDYLSDFFVLDTDPPPVVKITEPASPQLYARRLAHFYNNEEFADVIFIVEGKRVYGHKLVLSTVSDCFRAMFTTGFRESGSGCTEIEIPDTNYDIFLAMMEYIYTGRAPKIDVVNSESVMEMERAIALLELSDQFFLYNLKQICEELLQPAVNAETYSFLMSIAQKTNAAQLELYCRYFERNMNELLD
eukprot:CCRYP_004369-RA/>CCRYP_004369-RA protein AED:0.02 eAED:0.02 QI:551/1/1/1/1/1/2/63/666